LSDSTLIEIAVHIHYGGFDEVIEWCELNCASEWNLAHIKELSGFTKGVYEFTFTSESDAVLFSLRWV
jgi:hypothetical protein